MKVFERGRKINFVDDNNVLVGFDYHQSCCEDFGWQLTRAFPTACGEEGDQGIDPDGFQFDTTYFVLGVPGVDSRDGCEVVFRLTKATEEIFLTLWNHHNGYYSHGFEMTPGDNLPLFSGHL